MRRYFLISCLMLSGCASWLGLGGGPSAEEIAQAEAKKAAEKATIIGAEKKLENGEYAEALKQFKEFQSQQSQSTFYQAARLGEAQSLEGLGRFKEAVDLYRDIYLKTLSYQPDIAALAIYSSSMSHESLGDEKNTLASLLDARRLKEQLPVEVAEAEIPARLAAVYGRLGRDTEAVSFLKEADRGIAKVISAKGPKVDKSWLGKIYVKMGSVSTNQLSADSFFSFLRGQKWVQVYLIKAMRLDDAKESAKASALLQGTYRDLFTQISAAKTKSIKVKLAAGLLEIVDQAELYRPISGQKASSAETQFFTYLSEVRRQAEKIVYAAGETMTLTPESQVLNSIKRPGRVHVDSLLPEEEKSSITLPPKVVPAEDPNL